LPVNFESTLNLIPLTLLFLLNVPIVNAQVSNQLLIQNSRAILSYCTYRQFGVVGGAEFMRNNHIQGQVECCSDFIADHDSATGNRQNHSIFTGKIRQSRCQTLARVHTVPKISHT
jgi:hypothetical protein